MPFISYDQTLSFNKGLNFSFEHQFFSKIFFAHFVVFSQLVEKCVIKHGFNKKSCKAFLK